KGEFRGVFRIDGYDMLPLLRAGKSKDGLKWEIEDTSLEWTDRNPEIGYEYGYDPRVVKIEDKYFITWCNGVPSGFTIGLGYTEDFESFHQLNNPFLTYNRNGVLFPRKINGKYAMLSRPTSPGSDNLGSIWYSESPDLEYWGHHHHVMSPTNLGWQSMKMGPGPCPIETDEGWLLIYHGVKGSCAGLIYAMGCAILDKDEPWKVLYRTKKYIMAPWEDYECVGDVHTVVFPCATLCDADTGRLAIYYGAADTTVGLAFTTVDDLIKYTKENSY
ncbi:MAG: glycoside hydrolase family 130 protein, partial [Clostridia bacterium]|nr:glycoside hydrolase family 130 protein [Clostridia bacterium]